MSRKTVVFVSTLHRSSERFVSVLEDLSKDFDVLILNVGQASKNTEYKDSKRYLKKIEKFKTIDSIGIKNLSERDSGYDYILNIKKLYASLDFENIACVILDDSRGKNNETFLYKLCQQFAIPIIANSHGHQELDYTRELTSTGYKRRFDKFFCLGKKEQLDIEKHGYKSVALAGGIPENDTLLNYEKSNKHILVITNFLVRRFSTSDGVLYDKNVFEKLKLVELQKKLQKPVLFKVKHRFEADMNVELSALQSALPSNLDYSVMINCEDEHRLIADSSCVLSYGSTMAFKPIQLGIPTAIFKELGVLGNFEVYPHSFSVGEDYFSIFENKDEERKSFLNLCLEGGETFDSTRVYSLKVRETIDEYEQLR